MNENFHCLAYSPDAHIGWGQGFGIQPWSPAWVAGTITWTWMVSSQSALPRSWD